MERTVEVRYAASEAEPPTERAGRLAALLALGVERLLRDRAQSEPQAAKVVDLCPDLRVTSDGQRAGGDQE